MAKTQHKPVRKTVNFAKKQSRYPIGIGFVDIAGVREIDEDEDKTVSHRIYNDRAFSFEVTWEYNANRNGTDLGSGTEFFHAAFTSEQLFEFAAKAGLLVTTTSGEEPVPGGLAAAMRLTTGGAA